MELVLRVSRRNDSTFLWGINATQRGLTMHRGLTNRVRMTRFIDGRDVGNLPQAIGEEHVFHEGDGTQRAFNVE